MPKDKTKAYYICDELDCGFRYTYKNGRGPSKNRPILEIMVWVKDLDKKVKIRFVGFEEEGLKRLEEHGHGGYIFPVNLFNRPYLIDPSGSKAVRHEQHEKWLRLIAAYKGVPYVSSRKVYVLVAEDGTVVGKATCTAEEFADKLEYQKKWGERHPEAVPPVWHLAEDYEEKTNVGVMHLGQSQQAALVS